MRKSRPVGDVTPFTRILAKLVSGQDWMSTAQLAERCDVSPSRCTALLDEMRAEGLVKSIKQEGKEDRRWFYWHAATRSGAKEHARRVSVIREWLCEDGGTQ